MTQKDHITFIANITRIWGEPGRQWLESLPEKTQLLAQKWELEDLVPVQNLSYNYVVTGVRKSDNQQIVLKLSCDSTIFYEEVAALKFYNGQGCVKLFDYDSEHQALLLEQVVPGVSLKTLFPKNDEQAVAHAAQLMQKLFVQPVTEPENYLTMKRRLAALFSPMMNLRAQVPKHNLEKARNLAINLMQTTEKLVVLHGDLHYDNILLYENNDWIAIDPKGVVGDPAYEVGPFMCNPMPEILDQKDIALIIARRLELFSHHLSIPVQRLKDWSFVHAMLAACWSAQEGNSIARWLTVALMIDSL